MARSIEYLTGLLIPLNASMTGVEPDQKGFGVSLEIALPPDEAMHMVKGGCPSGSTCRRSRPLNARFDPGCYRNPSWPWWRQTLPAYTLLFLVPIYSFLATMVNLQSYRSRHAPVMVRFPISGSTASLLRSIRHSICFSDIHIHHSVYFCL